MLHALSTPKSILSAMTAARTVAAIQSTHLFRSFIVGLNTLLVELVKKVIILDLPLV